MKKYLKTVIAIAFMAFACNAWAAESASLSLGTKSDIYSSLEVDLLADTYAEVKVYCDNVLVLAYDTYGVSYTASGVSWGWTGPHIMVYYLPPGEYTGTLNVSGAPEWSYSLYGYSISWSGSGWAYVDFLKSGW